MLAGTLLAFYTPALAALESGQDTPLRSMMRKPTTENRNEAVVADPFDQRGCDVLDS